jgi:phage-related protein
MFSATRSFLPNRASATRVRLLRGFGDASVLEVIESREGSTYRAVYTVRFAAAVFVLHVFQKKSKSGAATPKPDMDVIEKRLKRAGELVRQQERETRERQERKP